jgi:hypothetical protein
MLFGHEQVGKFPTHLNAASTRQGVPDNWNICFNEYPKLNVKPGK